MQKEKDRKILYYSDELNDDFAGTNIEQKKLPEDFKYINKNVFFLIGRFLLHWIAYPIIWLMVKIIYHQKFVNKRVLKRAKKTGYFVYGNHTNGMLDAYIPTILNYPRYTYLIANPDAVSIKGIKNIVMMLGALPLPSSMSLTFKFMSAIKERVNKNGVIMIYPEAHIWPFYTDIRNFKSDSFVYPVEANKPVYCFTNVYKKRRYSNKPKVITFVDGPFYSDPTLTKRENIANLRNQVYETMKKRNQTWPKYEYKYTYIKKESAFLDKE
ncbi:MAG: 1-acyl-sn-glycerol-3-phosphate acyltransferase [Bacilli bacterium]|nr:1-acyl-sn-glycerol-3-phosphate acyltransferase [Bacilli bacterium]